ncbi:glycosyltransferase, partial [Agrococcus sp. HG114]|uniref:glycosyltransferase n=1 Tax=Agrococcus sp. HG114 TaxID=2969757 RepID=UPI00215A25FC
MLRTTLRRLRDLATTATRGAAARAIGVPLHAHATAAQDDRPSPRLVREIARLRLQNLASRRPVVDPDGGCVVSMTTHGARVRLAWVALESIARGERLPSRLVLFLDEPDLASPLPLPLRRLQRRGLEILPAAPGLRVHAKYWPHVVSAERHELPLVVSDDDMVYPRHWLRVLLDAHRARPWLVHAFRAHEIQCADGGLAPYRTWPPARGTDASFAHFGTGVSGQLLPTALLDALRRRGTAFLERAPRADDVWISAVAVQEGIRTAQVEPISQNFPFVPATQATGLYRTNVAGGENDAQLAATLGPADLERICTDARVRAAVRDAAPLLVAWGRFTDNPWQDIVERGARDAGFATLDVDHGEPLAAVLAAGHGPVVAHLNWTAPITQRADTEPEALASVDRLLAEVDALHAAGGALLWTVHNVLPHEQRHPEAEVRLLRGLADRADVIHVMHPATAAAVADVWSLPADREALVDHPSYRGVYPDELSREQARAALGVPLERTVVLLHGALREYKGVRALVEGFLAARAERADLHVLIAGRPGVGFDEADLAPLRGRDDATLHVGYVPESDVQRWHRAADALVMPYRDGLNSGALQLAATFGLPVVAFPCRAVEAAVAEGWAVAVDPASPRWLLDGLDALPADARERARASAEA